MNQRGKKRLATQADGRPLGGMSGAFAHLKLGSLPDGPPSSPSESQTPQGKKQQGRVVLRRETAHRGGKVVLIVEKFQPQPDPATLDTLAKTLRNRCGCGGAVKNGGIELQGEQAAKVREWLEHSGYRVDGIR